ncbi:hypothetical protein HYPSUDRAFT_152370, partial [Hypholoma sublateritium FD-334 SS-4]
MAVCQFFLRGQCRFGESCRNEHPATPPTSGFGNSSWTRNTTPSANSKDVPFTAAAILSDLSGDQPVWLLSSYGPSKAEPCLLAGIDESPEELRVKYTLAVKAGTGNEYLQYENNAMSAADRVRENARSNHHQAYEQALRNSAQGSSPPAASTSAFGSTSTPSAFGSSSTPSAFGNASAPTASAFGSGAP